MSSKPMRSFTEAWYRWKALRLPWRKRFLVGHDLQGNTYWEFRLSRSANERLRRIVHYPRSTHLSTVKVSPQWHQWLRYTREDPPTAEEQESDVVRQQKMQYLAAEADRRWEAKPKVMAPDVETTRMLQHGGSGSSGSSGMDNAESTVADRKGEKSNKNDPWAKARADGPGEKWQPTAWNPSKK